MKKLAILQMADQAPAESTASMLESVGYKVYLPDKPLRDLLRRIGCDTVLSPRDLSARMGYDPVDLPEIGPAAMDKCDLYCDIKAHRSYDKIVAHWPRLKGRILWTRIQGGKMERVPGCGDEVDPPCPVLTPNLWYSCQNQCTHCGWIGNGSPCPDCGCATAPGPWADKSFACWPPFQRWQDYQLPRGIPQPTGQLDRWGPRFARPICLVHGFFGWGYGALANNICDLGIAVYGVGAPDGLVQHREIAIRLSQAFCYVHLKSNDAPGYALYEALAAACPVICARRLIWRCKMEGLFIPGETCLAFDRETHDGLTDEDVRDCTGEIGAALERLRDLEENKRIGDNGRKRLKEIMWSAAEEDVKSLRKFMDNHFP